MQLIIFAFHPACEPCGSGCYPRRHLPSSLPRGSERPAPSPPWRVFQAHRWSLGSSALARWRLSPSSAGRELAVAWSPLWADDGPARRGPRAYLTCCLGCAVRRWCGSARLPERVEWGRAASQRGPVCSFRDERPTRCCKRTRRQALQLEFVTPALIEQLSHRHAIDTDMQSAAQRAPALSIADHSLPRVHPRQSRAASC